MEARAANGSEGRRKSDGSEGGAILEAIIADGGNAIRDCYGGEGSTTSEATFSNGGERRREGNGSEIGTHIEAIITEGGECGRKSNRSELTLEKGKVFYICDPCKVLKSVERFNLAMLKIKYAASVLCSRLQIICGH